MSNRERAGSDQIWDSRFRLVVLLPTYSEGLKGKLTSYREWELGVYIGTSSLLKGKGVEEWNHA